MNNSIEYTRVLPSSTVGLIYKKIYTVNVNNKSLLFGKSNNEYTLCFLTSPLHIKFNAWVTPGRTIQFRSISARYLENV
jgi:hypothetical protein